MALALPDLDPAACARLVEQSRRLLGLTQAQAAKAAGMTRSTWAKIETGEAASAQARLDALGFLARRGAALAVEAMQRIRAAWPQPRPAGLWLWPLCMIAEGSAPPPYFIETEAALSGIRSGRWIADARDRDVAARLLAEDAAAAAREASSLYAIG